MSEPSHERASSAGLADLRVVVFESRRGQEMGTLVRRYGGDPVWAPAMREVPVQGKEEQLGYLGRLQAGEIDVVVLMTGVGLRALLHSVETECSRDRVAAALRRAVLVARGPKPAAVLRELGLAADLTVPEPNTYREVLAALDTQFPVRGKVVAVQEYGIGNPDFLRGLEERGARVMRVSIYRWALPEDIGPLRAAERDIAEGRVDAALFTSATQVHHLFQVAGGGAERLREGLRKLAVGSIGPVCSASLREHGVIPDFEPQHPKMGHLVREAAQRAVEVLRRKRP